MELATSVTLQPVRPAAGRPAAVAFRVVATQQRPLRQPEGPRTPRRHTQYTLCQATAVARESPSAATSPAIEQQVQQLANLLETCPPQLSQAERASILRQLPFVQQFLTSREGQSLAAWLKTAAPAEQYVCLCAAAMGQQHVLILPDDSAEQSSALSALAQRLLRVDLFYNCVGGLLGYQLLSLRTVLGNAAGTPDGADSSGDESADGASEAPTYHMPRGLDLASPWQQGAAVKAVATGLQALPHMAEIYPLGGAGDRLGLTCKETGECVPAAVLPYCGRTLLEGLMRDVQAREYLYFRLFGQQHVTPIAMMTSDAKDNHRRLCEVMRAFSWFGRGPASFRIFRQPLVPVISSQDGRWLLPAPGAPMLRPGGHGAIWKLMQDEGIFQWLAQHDRQAALVRQISNPMAGADTTLLGLSGMGYADGRSFGFAACDRAVGASEGINTVMERRLPREDGQGYEHSFNVTNVEYTEFERLGIRDEGEGESGISHFPANTNVLYIGLQAAEMAVRADTSGTGGAMLPGMIFNSTKRVAYTDALSGEARNVPAGRLECTMQNLVDKMGQTFQESLPSERHGDLNTFVVFNQRRKVTSSAKRRRQPGSTSLAQTPDGSFRDLMLNAADLLHQCGFSHVPAVGDVSAYLQQGPGFVFLFHPALGPLWEVIAQKLRGGHLLPRSELVLEVAEAAITDLHLDGSLLVQAENPIGCLEAASGHSPASAAFEGAQAGEGRLVFSSRCGRVRMHSVSVLNQGLDWDHPSNVYWAHEVKRRESTRIILHGQSEFEASDVVLIGNHMFEVPDGYRMVVQAGYNGGLRRSLHPLPGRQPSWEWHYGLSSGQNIELCLKEPAPQTAVMPLTLTPEAPFIYVI